VSLTAYMWPYLAFSAAFGAVLGSFLNVCIHRLPRNQSVVLPPSRCPQCDARIAAYDNVPVLAWVWLRGRCRSCRVRISARYPLVEALTGLLFAYLFWHYGFTLELIPALLFAAAMIVVTLVDYDARIIPDSISLPGVVAGLLASLVTPVTFRDALIGAALGFFLLLAIAWGYRRLTGVEGMGGGDIKLAAMLGAFLGWQGLVLTIFLASLAGTLAGGVLMVVGRGGRKTALPFGTFLAPVALVVCVWGSDILTWYVRLAQR
jgi:leader peptidase (prepilin peptidase)/N-methyltransferase